MWGTNLSFQVLADLLSGDAALHVLPGEGDHRDPLNDGDLLVHALDGHDLVGIVGEQPDLRELEILEDGGRESVAPGIRGMSQHQIRPHRVITQVLKVVGLELLAESDATAFLSQVHHRATRRIERHQPRRFVELLAAVAACGPRDLAGVALGVNAHQRDLLLLVVRGGRGRYGGILTCSSARMQSAGVGAADHPVHLRLAHSRGIEAFGPDLVAEDDR